MKVLFLGNSHTYFNDMPELFARFVEKTIGSKPAVTMLAYSGRDLDWHMHEYFSLRFNLMYGEYDFCVIQQAAHPYPDTAKTLKSNAEIIAMCRRNSVIPVIFMTWAEKRLPENQQKMIDTCKISARDNDALIAPIGEVWEYIATNYPNIELYHTDGEHAGPYGDFLAAAVLCSTITGEIWDEVCGMGLDFLQGVDLNFKKPTVLEDKNRISVELERDKTQCILKAISQLKGAWSL